MSLITKVQKEYVTYWSRLGFNDNGEPTWSPPAQMKCRWDDMVVQTQTGSQTVQYSSAQLITQKPLSVGDIVLRGKLRGTPYTADPRKNPGAFEVLKVCQTPKINYKETLYEAYV